MNVHNANPSINYLYIFALFTAHTAAMTPVSIDPDVIVIILFFQQKIS